MSTGSALRTGLYIVGGLCLLGAYWAPQLLVIGLIIVIGLAVERSRYKTPQRQHIDPRWVDTGERFVDPETEAVTAVYFDPASAERHYVVVDSNRR